MTNFLSDFEHSGPTGKHVCLVSDVCGSNLDTEMTRLQLRRLPYIAAKQICKQMLLALDFLHTECGILHTDIQTSNILFDVQREHDKLDHDNVFASADLHFRLSDFGLACWEDEHLTDHIQPPVLRAPEIMLDAPWECSVDVFDLSCLTYCLVTGQLPFAGRPSSKGHWSAEDHRLDMLTDHFGQVPDVVLANASRADHFFDNEGNLRRAPNRQGLPLDELLDDCRRCSSLDGDMPPQDIALFTSFLQDSLATDPRKRKSARALIHHPWLQG